MELGIIGELKDKLNLSQISKPALIGIAVILVMVAGAGGRLVLTSTATASDTGIVRESSDADEGSRGDESAAAPIFVHVSGAVENPGLVELPGGSRVADAVRAAGGFAGDALQESVNLARPLEDGEQLKVLSRDEFEAAHEGAGGGVQAPSGTDAGAGAIPAASSGNAGKVNINTADEAQLTSLPGIGESTARKIVSDRASNGPFASIEDIKRVSGIGDKKYEALADLICV